MRSLFISIEGIDGSGGSTQAELLTEWLRNKQVNPVLLTQEPSSGPVGKFIRQVLTDQGEEGRLGDTVLPYLFAADRRDHLDREIIPMLQQGGLVISDRYLHSSLAYQSLAIGLPAVANLNAEFRQPDLILYLDLDPETCLQRIIARGDRLERFEAIDRLRRIRDAYSTVIVLGHTQGQNIVSIDASQSIDGVHADVRAAVDELEQSQNQSPPTA